MVNLNLWHGNENQKQDKLSRVGKLWMFQLDATLVPLHGNKRRVLLFAV